MYCKNCGADNNPSSAFCRKCGNPLEKAAPAPKPQASGVAQPISAGVLSKGWSDITGTVGWIKKVILLCLIESIPILGFSVDGYILRWGRELSLGENTPMPTEVFKKKEIITGFRAFLIRIMYGIAYFTAGYLAIGLITGLLALISPQFAAAVAILITACMLIGYVVVLLPLTNVAIMRMSVVDYLESGLNIKKIWNAFRKSPGSAIGATFVPIVSASVITGIVWSIVVGIFATFTNAMLNNVTHGIGDAPVGALNGYPYALTSLMGSSSIALFILSFLTVMLFAFVNMLSLRAMAHWCAQNASEWALESDEEVIASRAVGKSYGAGFGDRNVGANAGYDAGGAGYGVASAAYAAHSDMGAGAGYGTSGMGAGAGYGASGMGAEAYYGGYDATTDARFGKGAAESNVRYGMASAKTGAGYNPSGANASYYPSDAGANTGAGYYPSDAGASFDPSGAVASYGSVDSGACYGVSDATTDARFGIVNAEVNQSFSVASSEDDAYFMAPEPNMYADLAAPDAGASGSSDMADMRSDVQSNDAPSTVFVNDRNLVSEDESPLDEGPIAQEELTTAVAVSSYAEEQIDVEADALASYGSTTITLMRMSSGETYRITELPSVVGKGTAADVTIEGTPTISREHVRVMQDQGGIYVQDLNSTNGTFVNDIPVKPGEAVRIMSGDMLTLSNELFRISIG